MQEKEPEGGGNKVLMLNDLQPFSKLMAARYSAPKKSKNTEIHRTGTNSEPGHVDRSKAHEKPLHAMYRCIEYAGAEIDER